MPRAIDDLKRQRSHHLHRLLPESSCREMIARYDEARANACTDTVKAELIDECRERIFTDELNALLTECFQGAFEPCWPCLDVVGCEGFPDNPNAAWHLDGGIRGTHKLFIYLNAVAGHGGNTVMFDPERTHRLRQADALPVEQELRREDLSGVCEALGISPEPMAYDLKAGDGLLFDPLNLAHRCRPTKPGRRRYTICFSIVPRSVALSLPRPDPRRAA